MSCAESTASNVFPQAPPASDGAFFMGPAAPAPTTEERPMLTRDASAPSDDPPPAACAHAAGPVIRAREPGDWQEIAALRQLPRVRWGTLALPFVSEDATRKFMENPPEGRTAIVAVLDGKIVG